MHSGIEDFIRRFTKRLSPAERAYREARWRLATTGTEEAQNELVRAGLAYTELFADTGEFERVRGWYGEREDIRDPALRRQVEILYRMFAGNQGAREVLEHVEELEAKANAIYSNHRSVLRGREVGENEIREILRLSGDPELRREAWEASKTVGREVEPVVRQLARLRNELAREQGYENHYERSLDLQEIDGGRLRSIMAELERSTEEPFRKFKEGLDAELEERFGVEAVHPWLLSDPFFQEPPEQPDLDVDRYFRGKSLEDLTARTYGSMGLEVRDVMQKSDLYERPNKDQHAFCTVIGREHPYDVRVLANVRPDSYWMNTMLHEFGHAVYDKYIDPSLPYLLRTVAHTSSTEAIALMMGALADDEGWLREIAGVPREELAADAPKLDLRRRADRLVFTRWALVMFHFEQVLYENPDRDDLNRVWWDLVERLQLVERPPERDEPDWAAKIHIATAPVYYHNYVLGDLTAAQLRAYLEREVAGGPFFLSEDAGDHLKEAFFAPGARESWDATVVRATGEELDPAHFVRSLG
ncbi:peptidase M3A and M3B thimet/oligopeptidase F [Rubrobacter taiwanensis]|jgi:peptidyl-dipeptidase A|uniref:Peptidase M3A and M3B thimet/oligopeptidase F n=1 Tax=Rubrobacter taiwanensis TaxID=185139 RepID=A0A4R1B9P8_9ACTN|nr:M2 family metallopeptidase [Rubrobacter taiwanensis]TCJ13650.1 peptidase M3A and M3B thimet/oligopeptidase F [Rubrobacter taiwanensis]